jgi:hypothetical protein
VLPGETLFCGHTTLKSITVFVSGLNYQKETSNSMKLIMSGIACHFQSHQLLQIQKIILFTKYDSWKYEQEIRVFLALSDEEDGLYFKDFDQTLRLFTVIAGARCKLSKSEITNALGPLAKQVEVIKARAGFSKFEIVKDERGFQ